MPHSSHWFQRMALGAAGGFAGTLALQALLTAQQRWFPSSMAPLHEEPGEFMVDQAEAALPEPVRKAIPRTVEKGAAQMLGVGYGITFGALYGLLRPEGGPAWRDGFWLGTTCWAAGYLGWLPALDLMPPVWRQKPAQAIAPAAEHVVYGMTAVAAYDWLRERV